MHLRIQFRFFTFLVLLSSFMTAANEKPNIIIILADDMGFSDIGCYGGEISTPNLDKLAKEGVRFTQFYNAARCCPTRTSLLTGLYPHQAGMGNMTNNQGETFFTGGMIEKYEEWAERVGVINWKERKNK